MSNPDYSHPTVAGKDILITGGSGFVGSHLLERLLRENANVAIVARTRGKLDALRPDDQYRFFSCDLQSPDETKAVMSAFEPEIVFHLAAHPDSRESFEQAAASIRSNVLCTLNVLEAFRNCHGKLFIYGDSCKVYGDADVPYREDMAMQPISSYAIAKAAGWQFCNLYRHVHGVDSVSVRPTMIHGPRQAYNLVSYVVDCVLNGKEAVVLDGGSQTRDLLAVEDAIEAYVLVARRGRTLSGHVINIGGGWERSVAQLARMVLDILGSKIPVISAPERTRPTEMQRSFCDNAEAERLLGWRPALDLQMALEKTVAALVQNQVERTTALLPISPAASAA